MRAETQDQRQPLSGRSIVVTRPAHQAETLCGMIERAGGLALGFPALEIRDPDDMAKLLDIIARLAEFDLAIFISPNAVGKSAPHLAAAGPFPSKLQFAAIGRFTGEAMAESGFPANICPEEKFNSEGLLELPELQDMAGKRIVIFRGNEGRELLSETLRARGAEVEYAEAYRRAKPQVEPEFTQLLTRGEVDLITVTSSQALRGIFELAGAVGQKMLRKSAFLFGSQRILETAGELKLGGPKFVADNPGDEAMFAAILAWTAQGKRQ